LILKTTVPTVNPDDMFKRDDSIFSKKLCFLHRKRAHNDP